MVGVKLVTVVRSTLIYDLSYGILSLYVTRTGVEITGDLETSLIKGTRSTVSFSVMTHSTKNVGHQKEIY